MPTAAVISNEFDILRSNWFKFLLFFLFPKYLSNLFAE